ncbi:MAG: DUF3857 and transglutaminase domain-containing protein [Pyrinomonadaceae bacterium]|nr:DUF3857 and transglutaminase domain-containing protein [Pyrinomonadaceae bacterium]
MLGLGKLKAFLIFATLLSTSSVASDPVVWRPVTPSELAMDQPVVDKNADAEAIFWEVTLDDQNRTKLYLQHYVRVKIFTDRGREKFAKIDIQYDDDLKIENVAARVTKPDGTKKEVHAGDIFDREIFKSNRYKVRAKSFAVPGLEPGSIVEYQYRERIKGDSLHEERLNFQRDIPIQSAKYYLRPYKGMTIQPTFFNMKSTALKPDPSDKTFFVASVENMPAFEEEPYMPPRQALAPWVLVRYAEWHYSWVKFARAVWPNYAKLTKPDKSIKAKTNQIVAGADTQREKLRRIYDFIQTDIKNTFYHGPEYQPPKKLENKKASDILKNRAGSPRELDLLFASMAKAVGLDVALIYAGDRSRIFFDPEKFPYSRRFVRLAGIAANVDGKAIFLSPGRPFLPFGEVMWFEQNVHALLVFEGAYSWVTIPLSRHKDSRVSRKGEFVLDKDGTLSGTSTYEYTGHWAHDLRRVEFNETQAERLKHFEKEIKSKNSNAEISQVSIDNFYSSNTTLKKSYSVNVPGYAQITGTRLFVRPGVFEYGSQAVFSSKTRKHPVYFDFPWSEFDEIEIKLPEGYMPEELSEPEGVVHEKRVAGAYYNLKYDETGHKLLYDREFFVGGKGKVFIKTEQYVTLKAAFDSINKADSFVVALKKQAE